jgi:3-hydroxybutyrate dehydrogenase
MIETSHATLVDKVALVTGAASGIGLAVAQSLAYAGVKVCLADIQIPALERETMALNDAGAEVMFVAADLRSEPDIDKIHVRAAKNFGHVDILINNAGLQHVSALEDFPVDEWDRLMDTMLRGTFLCTKKFLPDMVRRGWGRIVNIASIHSVVASQFKAAYVSAKHGIIGLTKTVALEVGIKGVTVNAVSPAYVRTPLVERQIESQAKLHSMSAERVLKEVMLTPMPQKELIEPDEIGQAVLFLCSEAARHINGHNLVMDGGWTIT